MSIDSPKVQALALRAATVAFLGLGAATALHGQQAETNPAQPQPALPAASHRIDFTTMPDVTSAPGVQYSSSSSSDTAAQQSASLEFPTLPEDPAQPPPRRRYGRPRYNDSSHNADGSSKYGFLAGVGLTLPVQDQTNYLKAGYSFQVGAGRNFNKNFSLNLQFDWDNFGFTGQTISNQTFLENAYYGESFPVDGNTHIWSFTLNPTYNFHQRDSLGAYVVGGVGFYHKVANFTTPQEVEAYDGFSGYYGYEVNETFDHYTSNAPGVNGGLGLTYKPSRFANERFYAEVRYQYIFNSPKAGYTVNNYLSTNYNGSNLFPANSNRTSYLPIKFGIRF